MNAKQRRQLDRFLRQRDRALTRIEAAQETLGRINCLGEPGNELKWIEAAGNGVDGKPKLKSFSGVAYTGGLMKVGFGRPVVLDLEGLTAAADVVPFLKDHDPTNIVGHGGVEITKRQIKFSGAVSGIGEGAQEVVALAGNGFNWQMSVGVDPTKVEPIEAGQTVLVNGRNVPGPAYVVRAGLLVEVSFLAIGADGKTSGNIAAQLEGNKDMGFSAWLKAKGIDESKLDAATIAVLKANYEAEMKATADAEAAKVTAAAEAAKKKADEDKLLAGGGLNVEEIVKKAVAAATDQVTAAFTQQHEIEAVYASFEKSLEPAKLDSIKATAKVNKWNRDRVELECRRESRPNGPGIHVYGVDVNTNVISASFRRALGTEDTKAFDAPTLEASRRQFKSGIGLQQIIEICARRNGWVGHRYGDDQEGCLRAAFSTVELANILTVNFNYKLLQAYMAVEDTWKNIARIGTAMDYKTMTSYRMNGDMTFEELGANGEIKHGAVGEQTYTNQVDLYAKMFKVGQKDLVNDNLNAFAQLAAMIGRGGALKVNKVFWTAFMSGTGTFWHTSHATTGDTGNANYATGAGTALSIASLTAAELLFLDQVDPRGEKLGLMPRKLLVPNALNVTATQLMRDTEVRDTTASTKYTTGNPHAGKFDVVRSSYLNDSTIAGYSALAWYLTAAPEDLAVIEMAFLNGQQTPTVETAQADFDELGLQFRGYFSFGAAKQDFRAGVKMKGEA